jgi:hypothetical protein
MAEISKKVQERFEALASEFRKELKEAKSAPFGQQVAGPRSFFGHVGVLCV